MTEPRASRSTPNDGDEDGADLGTPVGSVGEEFAQLLQLLAERSTVKHPLVHVVRDHPQVVEHAADTLVSWVRGAQQTLGGDTDGGPS